MLSIIIPFYNESRRLGGVDALIKTLTEIKKIEGNEIEFVLVNDGSFDNTHKILLSAKDQVNHLNINVFSYEVNRGKGYAVRHGVSNSSGKQIIVMDADFSVDISEIPRFIKELETNHIVIGTKKHLLTQTKNPQKAPRRILGKGYTFITNLMLGLWFTDITCGFKAFDSSVAKKIFEKQKINRWAYDSETLFIAKKHGVKVKELPVSWYHIEGSTINPLTDTWRSFKDLLQIILNNLSGKYN